VTIEKTRTIPEAGAWAIDPAHTAVSVSARHLVVAKVRGSFRTVSGTITIGSRPETSSVEATVDAASIDTGVEDRDNHLRSPVFLDVANYETLTFRSTAVRPAGDGYEVDGELTIRGLARPITLTMSYLGLATDPWGNEKALFTAETTLNREDWGLTWNQALETGGWLVDKSIGLELEVQATRVAPDAQ
jgi:polyisoprenoid-binding protein YceI